MSTIHESMQFLAEQVAVHLPGEWTVDLVQEGSRVLAHLTNYSSQVRLVMGEGEDRETNRVVVSVESTTTRSTAHRPAVRVVAKSGSYVATVIESYLPGIRAIRSRKDATTRKSRVFRPGDPFIRVRDQVVGLGGGQQLYLADLEDSDLRMIDFRDADLRRANLRGADCTGSDFTGADLTGSHLLGTDFSFAKVVLPQGWELVGGRAYVKKNWRFDHKGRAFFQDRDATVKRLATLYGD